MFSHVLTFVWRTCNELNELHHNQDAVIAVVFVDLQSPSTINRPYFSDNDYCKLNAELICSVNLCVLSMSRFLVRVVIVKDLPACFPFR